MTRHANRRPGERGIAFVAVTILAILATAMIGTFLATSLAKVRDVEQDVAEAGAFRAAEAALNQMIQEAWTQYRSQPPGQRLTHMDDLDGKTNPGNRLALGRRRFGRSEGSGEATQARMAPGHYVDVEFAARGENERASHTIRAVVRFGFKSAKVFDNAYFINNYGWLWGAGITVNGSARSNGDMSLQNPVINGDVYAAENPALGAIGDIDGTSRQKTTDWYDTHYDTQVRPTTPYGSEDANGNGVLDPGEDRNGNGTIDAIDLVDGYDGTSTHYEHETAVDMPYLGDLETYRALARTEGGTISHGGRVVVDAVLGDDAGESENLLLVGTEDDPIILDGPVVVNNDVVLRGVIKGRGTIYAGRNVHVIGDLTYADPPVWPKPMTDFDAVKTANATKDLVGLSAKGSIILGDYTVNSWQTTTRNYQRPPFTQAYAVDPTDADIGYVSYWDDGVPMFDGNYTAYDGGKKLANNGTSLVSRKFFESSFSDATIHAAAGNQVQHVDAVLYTNHLLSGKIGACEFNGAIVSRDEAMIYSGSIDINYDIRVRYSSYEFLEAFLPRDPTYTVLFWRPER